MLTVPNASVKNTAPRKNNPLEIIRFKDNRIPDTDLFPAFILAVPRFPVFIFVAMVFFHGGKKTLHITHQNSIGHRVPSSSRVPPAAAPLGQMGGECRSSDHH